MYKVVLICLLSAACALGQNEFMDQKFTVQAGNQVFIGPGPLLYEPLGDSVPPIAGAPYSAQSTTEHIQTLADGNRIRETSSSTVYRDSQGRVRTERVLTGVTVPGGDSPHLITIDDPVAGANYTLDPGTKTAFRFTPANSPLAGAARVKMETEISALPGKEVRIVRRATSKMSSGEGNSAETHLGSQTMEGVLVQGTRITRTIPAGAVGNDQPIVITTETWFSPDLKVLVMSKSDDPRIGETTYKLTNVQRTEPSPALFQVPSDYTVKEGPGPVKTFFFDKSGGNTQPPQ